MTLDQGTLDVYAAVSVASVVVSGVLLLISLLNTTGRIRVPHRLMEALLVAAVVAVLLAVLL